MSKKSPYSRFTIDDKKSEFLIALICLQSGTLCGFRTYVGADDMWVS